MFFLFLLFFIYTTNNTLYCSHIKQDCKDNLTFQICNSAGQQWDTVRKFGSKIQPDHVINIMNRIFKRIDILWNVTYNEILGPNAENDFYILIANFQYCFPKECFVDGKKAIFHETFIYNYLKDVIAHRVEAYKACSIEAKRLLRALAPTSLQEKNVLHAVDVPVEAAPAAITGSVETAQNSLLDLSDWTKQECELLKKRFPLFNSEPIMRRIAKELESFISNKNLIILDREEKICFAQSMVRRLFSQMKNAIDEFWDNKYSQLMGENEMPEFYKMASHCLDGYNQNLLIFEVKSSEVKCQFIPENVISFATSHIQRDFQAYDKKKSIERQKLLLKEEEKNRLHQSYVKQQNKKIKECSDKQECERKKIIFEHDLWLQRIHFEQKTFEKRSKFANNLYANFDENLIQFLQDAKKDIEQQTALRKTMAFFAQKTHELFSSWQSDRIEVETQEIMQEKELQQEIHDNWITVARITMKRMQREKAEESEKNIELAHRLQEIENEQSAEVTKNAELRQRLQKIENQQLLQAANNAEFVQLLQASQAKNAELLQRLQELQAAGLVTPLTICSRAVAQLPDNNIHQFNYGSAPAALSSDVKLTDETDSVWDDEYYNAYNASIAQTKSPAASATYATRNNQKTYPIARAGMVSRPQSAEVSSVCYSTSDLVSTTTESSSLSSSVQPLAPRKRNELSSLAQAFLNDPATNFQTPLALSEK
ncbi:MAG TPA: hypothetical protein VLG50_04280 [Candidatus Saccharimonadales bacterium]|nr:hypothetical protein [Candidatus Saccharimonadales bacterium]